jgi:ATP-binding protein involved in chromosome partitioning
MDADIYGPSIPLMLGINTQPKGDGRNIYPLKRFDLQCISVGFFNNQGNPIVWRGPMVQKAIKQLLYKVLWKDIDILVIDLPPGTGDAHITLAVTVPLTGAVIVSTPQELALIDACKGLQMFRSVHVPVIGIIENMSSFSCPNCSHETAIFDQGSVKQKAKDLKTSFLGSVPLSLDLRKASDNGQPLINSDPNHKISKLYKNIAKKISAFICKKDLVQKKA